MQLAKKILTGISGAGRVKLKCVRHQSVHLGFPWAQAELAAPAHPGAGLEVQLLSLSTLMMEFFGCVAQSAFSAAQQGADRCCCVCAVGVPGAVQCAVLGVCSLSAL